MKALILIIIELNGVSECLFFTAVSYLLDSLQYKQFLVPSIDSSSC